jgi:SAM-dependent methyltransferase
VPNYQEVVKLFSGQSGLEIGGPSKFFGSRGHLPIYPVIKSLDNVNFATSTVWTGRIQKQRGYEVDGRRVGRQYIAEAANLGTIKKSSYDFVISSNCLEHVANPLLALKEWSAVLAPEGRLLVVVPKKESNFDHQRRATKFDHILSDYQESTGEDDLSHLEEILKFHDLELDPLAGTVDDFKKRSQDNFHNRCLHHHVFDEKVLKKMFHHAGIRPIITTTIYTDYLIVGEKE